jgi:hypothetical protein
MKDIITRYKIKENFDDNYSLVLINSDNKPSDMGRINDHVFKDGTHEYYLSFYKMDKFIEIINDFEFVLIFREKGFEKTKKSNDKITNLYKVSDVKYNIIRRETKDYYIDMLSNSNKAEISFSFRIEDQYEIHNIENGVEDFYNKLTQIRRELKLKNLGL